MKLRNIILMTASVAMTACSKQAVPTAIPEDAKIEQQVEELLSKMDLDAKIGPIFRMEPIISAVMDVARPLWRLWYPA